MKIFPLVYTPLSLALAVPLSISLFLPFSFPSFRSFPFNPVERGAIASGGFCLRLYDPSFFQTSTLITRAAHPKTPPGGRLLACAAHVRRRRGEGEGRCYAPVVRRGLSVKGPLCFRAGTKSHGYSDACMVLAIGINSPYAHASASFKRTVYAPGSKEGLTMQFPHVGMQFASVSQSSGVSGLLPFVLSHTRARHFFTRFSLVSAIERLQS